MDYIKLDENEVNDELEIKSRAVDACPGRGNYQMQSRGWGTIIRVNNDGSKDTIVKGGACWQYPYCYELLITEYDPLVSNYVGYYCMRNPGYKVSDYGAVIEASPNSIRFTSGSRVPYCNLD